MESSGRKGTRLGIAILGAGILSALGAGAPAAAQNGLSASERAGDTVAANLRTLAANPRSVAALMGAGKASLAVGDAQAALNFFARAEELLPKDGRIKMWIGSALVQLEQPRPALKFFEEAAKLGVADAEMAGDRGLVHDMLGDPRGAQRDYQLALRSGANPEITRRLALSLAISGERERALQLLEEQLLVGDPAAGRTRALVLALTGDIEGASRLALAAMPGGQGESMSRFLARLPSLTVAERALAVHFGHFPGDGRSAPATTGLYASLEPVTSAGAPDPNQPALGGPRQTATAAPAAGAPRRRPDALASATRTMASPPPPPPPPPTPAPVQRRFEPAPDQPATADAIREPIVLAASEPETVVLASGDPEPDRQPDPAPAATAAQSEADRLADLAATLAAIGDDPPAPAARPAPTPARTNARATATTSPARTATAKKPATPPPPREASRVWVQVAGGANRTGFPREFARLKEKAPRLLGSRTAWTVPVNATNRLLVGPFASSREAQAFINELAKSGIAGFAWTSAAGQRIERLAAR